MLLVFYGAGAGNNLEIAAADFYAETSEEQILHLKKWLENNGIELHITRGRSRIIASLTGDTSDMDIDLIRSFDMVENVQRPVFSFASKSSFSPSPFNPWKE